MSSLHWGRLGAVGVFVLSAILEVSGDALIRSGLRGRGLLAIVAGFLVELPVSTWLGLAVVLAGSAIIHLGRI